MDRAVLWCASGVIAFSAYVALILLFFFVQGNSHTNPIKFSSQKEVEFQVVLDFVTPSLIPKQSPSVQELKKSASQSKSEKIGSKTSIAGTGIKKLFDAIPDKIPVKNQETQSDNRDVVASRKKGERIEREDKIQENLQKILSQVNVKQRINFSIPEGEYDEYYAKVDAILSENWKLPKYRDSGYQNYASDVLIIIDDRGRFRYRIQKKSGDERFDEILKLFLNDMTLIEFPRYIHATKRETSIVVTIGSER